MLSAHWKLVLKLLEIDVKKQYQELEEDRDQQTRACPLGLACVLAFVDNTLWKSPLHTKMTPVVSCPLEKKKLCKSSNVCYLIVMKFANIGTKGKIVVH